MIDYSKFEAIKNKDGVLEVKPNVERVGNNITIHVPTMAIVSETIKQKEKVIKEQELLIDNDIGNI